MNNFILNSTTNATQLESSMISWVMMGIIVGGFIILFVGSIIIEIIRNKRKSK